MHADHLFAGFKLTLTDVTAKNDSGHDYTFTVNADGEVVFGEHDDAYYQFMAVERRRCAELDAFVAKYVTADPPNFHPIVQEQVAARRQSLLTRKWFPDLWDVRTDAVHLGHFDRYLAAAAALPTV